jgi:hypothetical protein
MSNPIDPFEPWRPPGYQPPHGAAKPSDSGWPEPRPFEQPARPDQTPPDFSQESHGHEMVLVLALFALVIATVVLFFRLPGGHVGRLAAAFVLLAGGLAAGISLARKCRWFVRLGWVAAGLVLAAAAWVFVPTAQGLNLWSAYHLADEQVQELRELEAGDTSGFMKGVPVRENVVAQFPYFKQELDRAEQAWIERSLKTWERNLKRLPLKDLAGLEKVRARYQPLADRPRLQQSLSPVGRVERDWMARSIAAWEKAYDKLTPGKYGAFKAMRAEHQSVANPALDKKSLEWLIRTCTRVQPEDYKSMAALRATAEPLLRGKVLSQNQETVSLLQESQAAWAGRTVRAVVARVEPLLPSDPAKASPRLTEAAEKLADFPTAVALLQPVRRRVLQARLDAAFRQVSKLASEEPIKDRSREFDDLAARLATDLGREAAALKMENQLADFRKKCQFLGKLTQSAAREAEEQ